MNFLVILICLIVNYLWLKDVDHFDDGWFFRFRCRVEDSTASLVNKIPLGWIVGIVLIYVIPLVVLAIVLLVTGDRFFGLITMMLHILVLLVVFDRVQSGKLAKDFLEKWNEGNIDACVDYLRQEWSASTLSDTDDKKALAKFFSKQLIYRSFEKIFVIFFWYMLTGPLGILFCYISYQLRDSHREEQLQSQIRVIAILIYLLEWIPVRLLALIFSLAGNFVQGFENVRQSFWEFDTEVDNADLLYEYARCAMSGMGIVNNAEKDEEPDTEAQAGDAEIEEIKVLLSLLERSQVMWLGVLALITILVI